MVRLLLEKGAKMDLQNSHGFTPLISAIVESQCCPMPKLGVVGVETTTPSSIDKQNDKHLDVIHALIDKECNLNLTSALGNTALSAAYTLSKPDVVDALLAAGCALNTLNSSGKTVLHEAVLLGDVTMVRKLLDRGADIDVANDTGHSPLDLAMSTITSSESSLMPFSQPLVSTQPTTSSYHFGVLSAPTAVTVSSVAASTTTAKEDTKVATLDERLEEIMEMLITSGCKLDVVISSGLLKSDTNPVSDGAIVDTLSSSSSSSSSLSSSSSSRPSVLSVAYRKYRMKTVRLLLSSPNTCSLDTIVYNSDNNGDSVLHLACIRCDEEFVKAFIAKGANVNIVNTIGKAKTNPFIYQ